MLLVIHGVAGHTRCCLSSQHSCRYAVQCQPDAHLETFSLFFCFNLQIDEQSGSRMYKVRWLGYDDPAEDTWQLEETFSKHVRTYDWKVPIPDWVPQQ